MAKQVTLDQSLALIKKVATKHKEQTLLIISQEWLKDSTVYVYKDKGDLQDSGQLHSDFKLGILRWRSPYARIRYFEGGRPGDGNRNARPRWADVAKSKNRKKYQTMAAVIYNKIKKEVFR